VPSAPAQPRRRRRDADANLDAVLDAATRVLADNPSATMAEIVSASGLGRVTAWRHVGSREQLLARLLERAAADIRQALDGVLPDAPATPADIGRAVEALATVGLRHRVQFAVQPGYALKRQRRSALAPLAAAIRRGQRAGTLHRGIRADLAATLVATAAHAAVQEGPTPRAVGEVRRFVEAGLAREPDSSSERRAG
jgi:TetR/AcrR family transcriptional regulator, mexCD-oprJ operon repressor